MIWIGTVLLGAPLGLQLPRRPERFRPRASDLRRCFSSPASAAAVGTAYLRRFPAEAREESLTRAIGERLPEPVGGDTRAELRQALGRVVQADFASGNTLRLQGWILSRTECRLCALVALA